MGDQEKKALPPISVVNVVSEFDPAHYLVPDELVTFRIGRFHLRAYLPVGPDRFGEILYRARTTVG